MAMDADSNSMDSRRVWRSVFTPTAIRRGGDNPDDIPASLHSHPTLLCGGAGLKRLEVSEGTLDNDKHCGDPVDSYQSISMIVRA